MKIIELVGGSQALEKLFAYGYLPIGQVFFLSTMKPKISEQIGSYEIARNSLLTKYGESTDGENYSISGGENVKKYSEELKTLEEQEIELVFPAEKLTLCVESVEQVDAQLVPDKRLGFSANDWIAIRNFVVVTEQEE